jgi:hypothetical protein
MSPRMKSGLTTSVWCDHIDGFSFLYVASCFELFHTTYNVYTKMFSSLVIKNFLWILVTDFVSVVHHTPHLPKRARALFRQTDWPPSFRRHSTCISCKSTSIPLDTTCKHKYSLACSSLFVKPNLSAVLKFKKKCLKWGHSFSENVLI